MSTPHGLDPRSDTPQVPETASDGAQKRPPTTVVAIKELGPPHSPWMWRQVAAMRSLEPQIIYWMPADACGVPAIDAPVHVVDAEPTPYDGKGRWVFRAANLRGRNFYAARGGEAREIKSLLRALNPSAMLCYYGEVALRTIDIAHELGIPTIAYFHGGGTLQTNRWYRWSLRRRLGRFNQVVVVGQEERAWMVKAGLPPERVHVIPCGAATSQFQPAERRPEGGARFVIASRLVEQKGCHYSIAAFAEVAAACPDATLDIYGDGPALAELVGLVDAHGLAAQVTFHGLVDSFTLAQDLPGYDVFLQHSLDVEGFGVSIAEAMACGLPVVATSVGGIVDLVADGATGFLVPERDAAAMARAMLRLAQSAELREQMGRAARVRVVESFDASAMTRRLEQLVREVGELAR